MKHISLLLEVTDDLILKSVSFQFNNTVLPDNSETLRKLASSILKGCEVNYEEHQIQDLINDIDTPEEV